MTRASCLTFISKYLTSCSGPEEGNNDLNVDTKFSGGDKRIWQSFSSGPIFVSILFEILSKVNARKKKHVPLFFCTRNFREDYL